MAALHANRMVLLATLRLSLVTRALRTTTTPLVTRRHSPPRARGAQLQFGADAPLGSTLDVFGRVTRDEAVSDEVGRAIPGRHGTEPVVKVYAVHSPVCPLQPWTVKSQEESTGSGFWIEHNGEPCILTNAHVVADATYVEVRKAGDARKYVATRRKVSHECDVRAAQALPTLQTPCSSLAASRARLPACWLHVRTVCTLLV